MRVRECPVPTGMAEVKARMAEIRARFHSPRARFGAMVAAAAGRADKPSGKVAEAISAAAARYGIDPAVLSAVVQCESGWRPDAVSPRGAMGLMQLMPKTAGLLGVTDPFDVEQNVDAGARYLREQLDRFGGDLSLALAAYNAGPGAVTRFGGIPPYAETEQFVAKVLHLLPGIAVP